MMGPESSKYRWGCELESIWSGGLEIVTRLGGGIQRCNIRFLVLGFSNCNNNGCNGNVGFVPPRSGSSVVVDFVEVSASRLQSSFNLELLCFCFCQILFSFVK
ncbi:scarecrow-like protein 22 [Pyrus ussuriensis x Pyrus communis]|uniref:Scarecrow-like protein 22 n=1 Tax=Pyrus ussuriensis x Pyrus communis TaxID=2448454 RepID=A0A5N5GZ11_9ROSA|nr:scarecrow-like protein 22 [Pyrus ussuriensis x Pyrus communis]